MSEQPDRVEINDPSEYGAGQRIKQIYEARRELRAMRREAAQHRKRKPEAAIAHYRTGVESYLMELFPLLDKNEDGRELWSSKSFGTVTISPPEPPETRYDTINSYSQPEAKHFEIRGFQTLFNESWPISYEFEFTQSHELKGKETETKRVSAEISWQSLNAMVSEANNYVEDLGIGLDVDDNDHVWQFEKTTGDGG